MDKKKKVLIIVIISIIAMSSAYVISTYLGMKQYEGDAIDNYKLILDDLYERNSKIISNKESLIKNIPNIDKNIQNIEKLVDQEKKDMYINDGIDLSNKIEQNVTTIINEYEKNKSLSDNEEIKTIMKTIIELDHNCSVSQKIFNKSVNDKDNGYNGNCFNNNLNKQLAKIFGLEQIHQFKSE